jgi:hypothetical protein
MIEKRRDSADSQLRRVRMPESAVKLGDTVGQILEHRILPQYKRFNSVVECWKQIVPAELAQHCRLADLTAGQLKVVVDSPSYMYELQLCRLELVKQLQRQCPQARVRTIELAVG